MHTHPWHRYLIVLLFILVTVSLFISIRTVGGPTTSIETTQIDSSLNNLIRVISPKENSLVNSPLTVTGEARGVWFFEATFPIKLMDDNDNAIAAGIATAQSEWMTESFVPFTSTLTFTSEPSTPDGWLILEKDNPSGLPENDNEARLRLKFE